MRYYLLSLCLLMFGSAAVASEKGKDAAPLTFEKHIRPIFKAHCFHCHGEEGTKGNLDLRLRRLAVKGGDSGPAIEPGDVDASYLYYRLTAGEMPPEGADILPTAEEIDTVKRWIAQGAKTARPEPKNVADLPAITPEEREYWAFQPIQRAKIPQVKNEVLVRTPIDAFLLEKLEAEGFSFTPEADKRTLIRRASFDLLGLPPTPGEIARFLADDEPQAYERMIDRLLSSPRYGERWGRHWLDIAGYADSEGYNEADSDRKHAYKYRDYVIRSLNDDKPFDLFLHEQLAGDEMIGRASRKGELTPAEIEKLAATGFLRMAPDGTGSRNDDPELARNDVLSETINIVSSSLLGMTVGCAQCHDHRFDPILQTDYYRMRAIFEPAYDWKNWRTPEQRRVELFSEADRRKAREIDREVAKVKERVRKKEEECIAHVLKHELKKVPAEQRDALREAHATAAKDRTDEQNKLLKKYPKIRQLVPGRLHLYLSVAGEKGPEMLEELKAVRDEVSEVEAQKPQPDYLRALTENPKLVPATYLFHRGDFGQPGDPVPPGGLTVLYPDGKGDLPENDPAIPTTGRRLNFARQLTDGSHPLTARVLVNRFWLHHFGRGIVATPGDFGRQGAAPTHPELLDWLANEFIHGGWRLKDFHKLIMTSTAYRQSTSRDPAKDERDPDNELYGRMPIRRLAAEEIRDTVLAVSGDLNLAMFGTPTPVKLDGEGQIVVENTEQNGQARRSIYIQIRRSQPVELLDVFDAPRMEPNCELRHASTVAPQSLMLMNSEFIVAQSERFAARVEAEADPEREARIHHAWELAYGRLPTAEEFEASKMFLDQQTEHFAGQDKKSKNKSPAARKALASFCQVLLGSNQFLYVE